MYLDANIIVYAVTRDSKYGASCKVWLEKIAKNAIQAESSPFMLIECLHAFKNLNRILPRKKRPTIDIPQSMIAILSLPIQWIELTPAVVLRASEYTRTMTAGDAVHLASMEIRGIPEILSADTGFDAIANVSRRDPLST
jgi:predicted nucleic acid-binding protein